MDALQLAAALLGLLTIVMYVFGGLIVFLHLARYGIIDYQLFQLKFLVTGIYFSLILLAAIILSFIPALFLAASSNFYLTLLLIASLISSIVFVFLRHRARVASRWHDIRSLTLLILVSAIGFIFPIAACIRSFYSNLSVLDALILRGLAFSALLVLLVTQAYYYAVQIYGVLRSRHFHQEPFGLGIPVRVRLVGSEETFTFLLHLGIPLASPTTTALITRLDETSDYYIVRALIEKQYRAAKIAKDIVKGVLYVGWE